jgi:hypothetical protein
MSGSHYIIIPGKLTIPKSAFKRLEKSQLTSTVYIYYTTTATGLFGTYEQEDCLRLTKAEAAIVEQQLVTPECDLAEQD